MADRARFDSNLNPSMIAVSSADGTTPVSLWADPVTHALPISATISGADGAITDGVTAGIRATVFSLTNSKPLATQIVDATGTAITSFGGGTQYTDQGAVVVHPTGPGLIYFDSSNTPASVGTNQPLPVIASQNGTWSTRLTDGTNVTNVLKSDGTAAGQNATMVGGTGLMVAFTTTTVQAVAVTDVMNYRSFSVHQTTNGTSSVTTIQGSNDNTNWVNVAANTTTSTTGVWSSSVSTNSIMNGPISFRYFRLNVTGISAGTTSGNVYFSTLPFSVSSSIGTTAQQSGTWTVGSNSATGSAAPANGFYEAVLAQTALPTAATAGNLTGALADKFGRHVVLAGTIRDLVGTQTTTISASTSETTIVTATASTFNDLTALVVSNTSGAAARVDFRDTTAGSVLFSVYVPAGDVRGVAFQRPVPQTAVNTNWTAQSNASVTDLRVYAVFDKNK